MVVALGHRALGTTLPEQQIAVRKTVKSIADLGTGTAIRFVITHSNAPQLGMIHTAMNEFGKNHPDYTPAPMSVCSAMTQATSDLIFKMRSGRNFLHGEFTVPSVRF